MILYHITSLEKPIQSILIPKIPDETEIGENYTEKRICLAPSILECLKSAEIVNKFDDEVGLVRVYKVKINEDDPNLVGWNKLYEEGLVPDAALIGIKSQLCLLNVVFIEFRDGQKKNIL